MAEDRAIEIMEAIEELERKCEENRAKQDCGQEYYDETALPSTHCVIYYESEYHTPD